jgi:hypothetical protein
MGYSGNSSRAVIHGSRELGGMNWRDLQVEQELSHMEREIPLITERDK